MRSPAGPPPGTCCRHPNGRPGYGSSDVRRPRRHPPRPHPAGLRQHPRRLDEHRAPAHGRGSRPPASRRRCTTGWATCRTSTPTTTPSRCPRPSPTCAARIAAADAVLFCTPEYAGALPGTFKNLLDWTVGGGEMYGKPVAWVNASGSPTRAADAHASLRRVLGYTGTDVVAGACVRIPVAATRRRRRAGCRRGSPRAASATCSRRWHGTPRRPDRPPRVPRDLEDDER